MNKKEAIKKGLQTLVRTKANTLSGIVKDVSNDVCTVTVGNIDYYDVRLTAIVNENEKTAILPKIGSDVLISFLNGSDTDAYVSAYSEIEKVIFIAEKFTLKNNTTSLKALFNELITELKAAIITTPAGAGSVSPTTIAKLDSINAKVNNLFEE